MELVGEKTTDLAALLAGTDVEALRAGAAARRAAGDDAGWLQLAERWTGLAPGDARAFYHQGFAAKRLGRAEAARAAFARAVALEPRFASARLELAVLLLEAGENEAAVAELRTVVAQAPGEIQARVNLGAALRRAGRPDEAEEVYAQALALAPDHADLHVNLANLLVEQERTEAALPHLQRAAELRPQDAQARLRLGNGYRKAKRPAEAYACYRQALRLRPGDPQTLLALAIMAHEARRYGLGEWLLRRVTAAAPDDGEGWLMLGSMLYAQGRVAEADAAHAEAERRGLAAPGHRANALMYLNYRDDLPAAEIALRHSLWGRTHAATAGRAAAFANTPEPLRRLRIGYLSPDFRHHSVSYFLQPLIEAHDRGPFEIHAFANVEKPDGLTERYRGLVDGWHDVRKLDDAALARLIEAQGIDILVELAGHTGGTRLPACRLRPAPVQASWLGYPNSTGLPAMDWRLVDAVTDPPGAEALAVERLYRLPQGFLCYRPSDKAPEVSPLPMLQAGLEAGRVTFGTFNNPAKLSPATVACWSRLLLALPQSRLLLGSQVLTDPLFRSRLRRRFERLGVPRHQLDLRSGVGDHHRHLLRYHEIDIGLDPFPYAGTTTTCESLWMGVPVVTLAGEAHVGRVGASILHRLGLGELAAADEDGYVAAALRLAADPDRLAELRAGLRSRMRASPLMDEPGFARQVEAAYREMWRDWCGRQASIPPVLPESLALPESPVLPAPVPPETPPRPAAGDGADRAKVAAAPAKPLPKPVAARLERAVREERWDEAAEVARRVLRNHPGEARAWRALTLALAARHAPPAELAEAARAWRAAEPKAGDAPYRLGLALLRLGRAAEARDVLLEATTLSPGFAQAWLELGVACSRLDEREAAVGHFARAAELRPGLGQAYANQGAMLRRLGRYEEARKVYEAGLVQASAPQPLCRNLGNLLTHELCRPDEAAPHLRRAVDLALARDQPDPVAESDQLLNLNYLPLPAADVAAEHAAWGRRQMARARPAPHADPEPPAMADRRLRVGYLSPDLCRHSVSHFIAPVLAAHDRQAVDVVVYADVEEPDAVTARLHAEAGPAWRDVHGLGDADLAALIRADGIDVLVELAGHTKGNRLAMLASRPAPVQASWLGYPHGTGLPAIGWRIVDAITDPPGSEALAVEALCRLPRGFLAFATPEESPEPGPPPVLRHGSVTFGSFNNGLKLCRQTVALWGRLMAAVPGSRLLLKGFGLAPGRGEERLRAWLEAEGIAAQRLQVLPHIRQRAQHLALYGEVDIALDPFPYNGTTTTCEALWMGVPVLTLAGDRHAARVGASILRRLGLDELVAEGEADFLARGVALAGDPGRLAELRAGMRRRFLASPLADAQGLARDLEAAYRGMWRQHAEGSAPQPIGLPAAADARPAADGPETPPAGPAGRAETLPDRPAAAADGPGQEALEVELADGVRAVVPADLRLMTPFVLLEQEGWFEAEAGFVAGLLRQGEAAIDVGANYGLYTLAMARAVGPDGLVLAVEPASRTLAWLRRSLAANGFAQVRTVQAALSDHAGEAVLSLYDNAELNRLHVAAGQPAAAAAETVRLATLDELAERLDGRLPVFVKLDAEGEEERIVRGGQGLLGRHSPLVMLEIKAERNPSFEAVAALARLGYAAWRLVPGLGLLAPVDPALPPDGFELNLFCCKPDRAQALAARGLLVLPGDLAALATPPEPGGNLHAALADAVAAGETQRPAAERLLRLRRARHRLGLAQLAEPGICRLASLVRVARDLGERELALTAATRLRHLLDGPPQPLAEPLLPPDPGFDQMPPGDDLWGWLRHVAAEAWIGLGTHSSRFAAEKHYALLTELAASPLCSPAMLRRRQLLLWGTGHAAPVPEPLTRRAEGHRNAGLWRGWAEGRPLPAPAGQPSPGCV